MILPVPPVGDLWKKSFRLSRAQFNEICNELKPYISPNIPPHISSGKKGCCCIMYYVTDIGTMTMTANTFGIHQCTLTQIVKEVCGAIATFMVPKLIKLSKILKMKCYLKYQSLKQSLE